MISSLIVLSTWPGATPLDAAEVGHEDVLDRRLTRRTFACMLGLGGVAAVASAAESTVDQRARWNARTQRVEIDALMRDRLTKLIGEMALHTPGMVANLVLAEAMDLVSEYVRNTQGPADPGDPKYLDTAMKANMLLIGKLAYGILILQRGAEYEDRDLVALVRRDPFAATVQTAIIFPIIEELLFRLLPARYDRGWVVGAGSSLVFALGHNLGGGRRSFDRVPVTHFIAGMFYWYLMREKGFDHAVFAHAANNQAYVMGLYFFNRFP